MHHSAYPEKSRKNVEGHFHTANAAYRKLRQEQENSTAMTSQCIALHGGNEPARKIGTDFPLALFPPRDLASCNLIELRLNASTG
jgi:hypothetical protein